jgi:serine protease inhibitor
MTILRLTSPLALSLLLLGGCDHVAGPGKLKPGWTEIPLDERVTDAYTGFGFELFRRLRAEAPEANVFVSPSSAAIALAMTYDGAAGTTADEMAAVLGIGHLDRELVNETNRTWLEALRETRDPRVELALANSIWYRETYTLSGSFVERVQAFYGAEVAPITGAGAINGWVEQATRGRIEEIVRGEIPGNVVAYLINALYFKADWTYQFEESSTRAGAFRLPDGNLVQVPMMAQERAFDVRRSEEMSMLRLPYGAGRFSMILALPEQGADLASIAAGLEAEVWRSWMTEFVETPRIRVELPRFELEWESSLAEVLQAMGMETPFEPGLADFSAMFSRRGPWIDDVLQKTYLRVDEKGTEAAAVTSVVMVESAAPAMTFDRPFFLAIHDHATSTVLFLGQITDPRG